MSTGPGPQEHAPPEHSEAMAAAGRMLARRRHSRAEVAAKLREKDFPPEVVSGALDRLEGLRLVDDLDFATAWIEQRRGKRTAALLLAELEAKGVAREIAEEALSRAGPDELAQAVAWAERLAPKVAHKPLREQGLRLMAMLARKGVDEDAAREAAGRVLPPEGWD